MKELLTIHDFVRSLDARQFQFFVEREAEHEVLLQQSLRDLARGLNGVSALHSEKLSQRLSMEESPRSTLAK